MRNLNTNIGYVSNSKDRIKYIAPEEFLQIHQFESNLLDLTDNLPFQSVLIQKYQLPVLKKKKKYLTKK